MRTSDHDGLGEERQAKDRKQASEQDREIRRPDSHRGSHLVINGGPDDKEQAEAKKHQARPEVLRTLDFHCPLSSLLRRQSVTCAPATILLRSMSASRFVLLALLSLQPAGCGERPRLEPLPESAVVLAFGDSLTFGTGPNDDESYPARLEKLIGRRVVRAGVPGELTAQALARLPATLDEHPPRLLLLCIGGNDFLRRLDLPQAENNVRAMVKPAKERRVG